ncbi:uncharacterized protein LOC119697476 [Motacilla alba alba]|uniref:uncharacterized protein LOC119697476 n=1 Tax=Motacilla alba alba TaxID=1094192 RepID=UPI0018D50F6F|nr:uncharacterized protein LOC119697476 [Motacilla alba alba]
MVFSSLSWYLVGQQQCTGRSASTTPVSRTARLHPLISPCHAREKSPSPAPEWGHSQRREFFMNFCSMSPSHRQQASMNSSNVGPSPEGAAHKEQVAIVCVLHRVTSPTRKFSPAWVPLSKCLQVTARSLLQCGPLTASQPSFEHAAALVWAAEALPPSLIDSIQASDTSILEPSGIGSARYWGTFRQLLTEGTLNSSPLYLPCKPNAPAQQQNLRKISRNLLSLDFIVSIFVGALQPRSFKEVGITIPVSLRMMSFLS